MKSKDLIKEVEKAGWQLVRVKGSDYQFKHPDHKLPLTKPNSKKDLGLGLVKAIKKQAGLSSTR